MAGPTERGPGAEPRIRRGCGAYDRDSCLRPPAPSRPSGPRPRLRLHGWDRDGRGRAGGDRRLRSRLLRPAFGPEHARELPGAVRLTGWRSRTCWRSTEPSRRWRPPPGRRPCSRRSRSCCSLTAFRTRRGSNAPRSSGSGSPAPPWRTSNRSRGCCARRARAACRPVGRYLIHLDVDVVDFTDAPLSEHPLTKHGAQAPQDAQGAGSPGRRSRACGDHPHGAQSPTTSRRTTGCWRASQVPLPTPSASCRLPRSRPAASRVVEMHVRRVG
jgi:hypothetical protein